ncbi:hypothetical protein NC651_023187 [Populus alba x Populus x berolinensis]|nr:hypothetical protein NC651_023187 [Populus alba x Populus x berolinensis]
MEVMKSPSILDSVSSTALKNHQYTGCHKNGDNFSRMNYESLQLCTEGLGFESSDDVEDLKNNIDDDWRYQEKQFVHPNDETIDEGDEEEVEEDYEDDAQQESDEEKGNDDDG